MGHGAMPDDDGLGTPPPPPHARTWRHPSEIFAATTPTHAVVEAPALNERRRYSLASLILAGASGALAMALLLGAMDTLGRNPTRADANASSPANDLAPQASLTPDDGIVTIRVRTVTGTSHFIGLVIDRHGDVVTTAPQELLDSDRSGAVVSARTIDGTWVPVRYVVSDSATGISVIKVDGAADTVPVEARDPELGRDVFVARASATSDPVIASGSYSERIVGTNSVINAPTGTHVGLATMTTTRLRVPVDLALDAADGVVVGLVVSADDDPEDGLAHVLPAHTAVRAGRQLVLDGRATHGHIDASLDETSVGVVVSGVDPASQTAAAGLRRGDRLVSIAGRPITKLGDVIGALFTRARTPVEIVVVRDGTRLDLMLDPPALGDSIELLHADPLG